MKTRILMNATQAKSHFLCSDSTLRRWHKEKKIEVQRTLGNTRRYWVEIEVPDEEAPPTEEELELVAEKEAADKLKDIEEKKARWIAIEDKDSLTARWLMTCLPHEMRKELESLQ